jgi:hypothetical protein
MAVRKTTVQVRIIVEEYDEGETYTPVGATREIAYNAVFTEGTGQGQANRALYDDRQYTASTAVDLDVNTYTDDFGQSKAIAGKMRLLAVRTHNTGTGEQWQVGGDTNSIPVFGAAPDYLKLGPNGLLLWVDPIDGITCTAGTGDIMQITPPAVAARAQTLIVGSAS